MSGVLPARIVIRSKRNVLWIVLSLDATRSTAIAAPPSGFIPPPHDAAQDEDRGHAGTAA